MISQRSEYLYAGQEGSDLDEISITGDVAPNSSSSPYTLQGEDVALLCEAKNELLLANDGNESRFTLFDNSLGPTVRNLDSFFRQRDQGAYLWSVLKPGQDFTLFQRVRHLDEYRPPTLVSFPDWYAEVFGAVEQPEIPSLYDNFYLSELLKVFRNQRRMTRIYVPINRRGSQLSGYPSDEYWGDYSDEDVDAHMLSGRPYGVTDDDRIPSRQTCMELYHMRDHAAISAGREFVFFAWNSGILISPWSHGYDYALEIGQLPAACTVTPVCRYTFDESYGSGPSGYSGDWRNVSQDDGYFASKPKTTGAERYNSLKWTWSELCNDFRSQKLDAYAPSPGGMGRRPSVSDFPAGANYYDRIFHYELNGWIDGFVIDMGERTKWW